MKADAAPLTREPCWRTATVNAIVEETPRVRSLSLCVPGWTGHRPGQHVDIRLPGSNGETRSYSIASAPEEQNVTITVERNETSRFSRFLTGDLSAGGTFDLRGPIGDQFVWDAAMAGPLFLIAGGSGIVPLMAMLRHRAAANNRSRALLIYSSSTFEDIVFHDELERLACNGSGLRVIHTLTRQHPAAWSGETKRVDSEMLSRLGFPRAERPRIFICGPSQFANSVAAALTGLGHASSAIRIECYGSKA